MLKKVFSLILALVLVCVPLFGGAGTVHAASVDDMESIIEKQIRAFADSIDQANADDKAAAALATHGMGKGGKKLSAGKSHALTATLFNSELLQAALTDGCSKAIRAMHQLDLKELANIYRYMGWYSSNTEYGDLMLCSAASFTYKNWDTQLSGGKAHNKPLNEYDASLEWIAGSASFHIRINRTKRTADSATYKVTCTVYDRFDFDTSSNSFFKTLISGIGALLFREFDWEATASFNLTVPYDCSHGSAAYRWTYDAESHTLISDTSGDWKKNEATGYSNSLADGSVVYYHELEEPIRLHHDRPWVLEYDINSVHTLALSAMEYSSVSFPGFLQGSVNYLKAVSWEPVVISQETAKEYDLSYVNHGRWHYYGIDFKPLVSLDYNKIYTMRLENEIHADGSNMIYLTVVNTKTGEVCMDHVPMDDYVQWDSWSNVSTLISRTDTWFSGRDFSINFIGNQSYSFHPGRFDLRVWENGENGESYSYYEPSATTAPTCTTQGYTTYTCSCCGYSYKADKVKATGHSFDDWTTITPATCTESGEEQHKCKNCDVTENRTLDATGHNFENYVCTGCGDRKYVPGDVDMSGIVDVDDVLALLWHVLFPEDYPIDAESDFDGNGTTDVDDVLTLLWHVLFPDDYPIEVDVDFDHNGSTDVDDVLTLLWHVLFPDDYPL